MISLTVDGGYPKPTSLSRNSYRSLSVLIAPTGALSVPSSEFEPYKCGTFAKRPSSINFVG